MKRKNVAALLLACLVLMCTAGALADGGKVYEYFDPLEGKTKQKAASEVQVVTSAMDSWTTGWYVLEGNIGRVSPTVTVTGDVNLILMDNSYMYAYNGIVVNPGNSLTIWAQSRDEQKTGKLESLYKSRGYAAIGGEKGRGSGNISIFGGKIIAKGGQGAAGIGAGEGARDSSPAAIQVNNAYVEAESNGQGAGIGGGTYNKQPLEISLKDSSIFAKSRHNAANIGTGENAEGDVTIRIEDCRIQLEGRQSGMTGIGNAFGSEGKCVIDISGDQTDIRLPFQRNVYYSTGIGAGQRCSGKTEVAIRGGKVNISSAYGFNVGIGANHESTGDCEVRISGDQTEIDIDLKDECNTGIGMGQESQGDLTLVVSGGSTRVNCNTNYSTGIGMGYQAAGKMNAEITGGRMEAIAKASKGVAFGKYHGLDDMTMKLAPAQTGLRFWCDKNQNRNVFDFVFQKGTTSTLKDVQALNYGTEEPEPLSFIDTNGYLLVEPHDHAPLVYCPKRSAEHPGCDEVTWSTEHWYCPTCKRSYTNPAAEPGMDFRTHVNENYFGRFEPQGHKWSPEPEYIWSSDHKACTARNVCERSSKHVRTAEAVVTVEVTEATTAKPGKAVYTAKFGEDADWAKTQVYEAEIPMLPATGETGLPMASLLALAGLTGAASLMLSSRRRKK